MIKEKFMCTIFIEYTPPFNLYMRNYAYSLNIEGSLGRVNEISRSIAAELGLATGRCLRSWH